MALSSPLRLGATGPEVLPLGLGCMGMSGMYGPADEAEAIATIHEASERGPLLLDTGDFYGMGHNERLVGRAIAGRRDRVVVSVKFGAMRGPDGAWLGYDGRPAAVKNFLSYSLDRLGLDHVDVYRPSRLDPTVPIEDTIGAIADLVKAGYVRHIGLSEVGVETIRRAVAVHPVVDLQIEYSLASRGPERAIFPALRELGLSATLYGVFGRGLLTGSVPAGPRDFRAYLPRFAGAAGESNARAAGEVAAFAAELGVTPGQLTVAWALARQPGFVPLVGARTRARWADAVGALDRPLAPAELAELERRVPADAFVGDRYAAPQMAMLDSER